jgi:hypothetical protein
VTLTSYTKKKRVLRPITETNPNQKQMAYTQELSTTMKNNDTVPNNTNDFELTIEEIREFYYQAISSRQSRSGGRENTIRFEMDRPISKTK